MRSLILVVVAVLAAFLSGCASVPMAPLEQDKSAKNFIPAPGKGKLFIYRNETYGAAVPLTVSVNGKTLGQTAAMTYFHLNVSPGKYTVSSHAENVSQLSLDVLAGKTYFVWQEIKMGMWSAASKLQQVDENTGRAGVSESKLIATSITDSDFDVSASNVAENTPPPSKKLRDLQELRKEGVITEDEFERKKNQLLKEI